MSGEATTPALVVALGGNALLPGGAPPSARAQHAAARAAAQALAPVARTAPLVVTHGNGPQVGLLAEALARSEGAGDPEPLDDLDAETEGQIGYLLEVELGRAVPERTAVALVTTVEVDARDPAFAAPTKPIGPRYDAAGARRLAERHGWAFAPDGDRLRRVVASPEPRRIVQLDAIAALLAGGFLVVCAGGGGVPVARGADGTLTGVEAVVDKDLTSALLASALNARVLVLATDVDAVYAGWGTAAQTPLHRPSPEELRSLDLPAGSMAPKVRAALRFLDAGGERVAIGALADLAALVAGQAGTQVTRAPLR